jgi:hypothetical protein
MLAFWRASPAIVLMAMAACCELSSRRCAVTTISMSPSAPALSAPAAGVDPDVARCALAVAAQSGTNINEYKANANHLFIKRSPDFLL